MEKCRTFYLGKDESLEIGQPCARLKQLKMRQVGWKIMGSGNKTTLVLEKARTLIRCCSLWAAAEGEVKLRVNTPETPLSPCFLLMFLFSTLLRRSTETRRLAQLCWEQSTFVIGLLPPNLIKWCCSPLGREYSAKQKNVSLQLLPQQQRAAWLMKLCQANCFQHDAVGQHSISRTHTSDCGMLMDSPKESFPITHQGSLWHWNVLCGLRNNPASERQLSVKV